MQKSAIHTVISGIFTHLVNEFSKNNKGDWYEGSFGGSLSSGRCRPYLIFGVHETRAWRSVTFDGEHHRINLELQCGAISLSKSKVYAQDIISSLHGAEFSLKGHALIEIQHEKADYIKLADKNEYLVRLLFTVLTVSD